MHTINNTNDRNDTDDFFEIKTKHETFQLRSFYDQYLSSEQINLHPEYQRDFVWNGEQQNLFIDSIMRGFIVPGIIFIEDDSEKYDYECIDGQHRLKVIRNFIKGEPINGHNTRWIKKNDDCIENIFYEENNFTKNARSINKKYMTNAEKNFLINLILMLQQSHRN